MPPNEALAINDNSSVEDSSIQDVLRSCAIEYAALLTLLFVAMSLYVGFVFGLIALVFTAPILHTASFYDYFAMLILFGMGGWTGILTRIVISGPCMNLTTNEGGALKLKACQEIVLTVGILLLIVGIYCLGFGAYYVVALVIFGVPFGIGCALHSGSRMFLRRVFRTSMQIPIWKHRMVRATCPALTIILMVIIKISWVIHRESLLVDHVMPHEDIVHGAWDMVMPTNATTGYWSLEFKQGPPASDFQDFSNHAFKHAGTTLSTKVVKAFVAMPLGFHAQDLACAHVRGQPGYIVLLHDNGVLGFVPKIFDARQWTKHAELTKDELICFAQAEDSRFTVTDVLHGVMHGCFCFGKFGSDGTMQRYNRWAWDTGHGWQATRRVETETAALV